MVARIKAGIFTSFNAKKVTLRGFPKQSVLLTGRKVLAKAAVAAGENALLFRSPVTERQPRSLTECRKVFRMALKPPYSRF